MSQGRPVKDLWWEEDTFCTEFEDGTVMKFEGAYMSSINYEFEDSDCIQTETFVTEPFFPLPEVVKPASDIVIKIGGVAVGVVKKFKGDR